MTNLDERLWLVKSSGRILGPYSIIKIKELLRTKELVPLDETCLPMRRWQHLREVEDFQQVIQELKVQELRKDENTETVGQHIDDMTASVTMSADSGVVDELTAEVSPIDDELTKKLHLDSIDVQQRMASAGSEPLPIKRYGTAASVRPELRLFTRFVWLVTILAIVGGSGFVFYKKYLEKNGMKLSFNQDFTAEAFKYYQIGKYEKALDQFRQAYNKNPSDASIYLYYGTLLIQVDRQTVQGKRLLTEVLKNDYANRKYALAGIGLADMIDGEFKFAERNFNDALNIDPNFTSVMINMAIIDNKSKRFTQAHQKLQSAMAKGGEDNSAQILLAKNLIDQFVESKKRSFLTKAENNLRSFVQKNFDYKQEAYLLLSYIQHLKNTPNDIELDIISTLDIDPTLTSMHKHDLLIYRETLDWRELLSVCNEILSGNREDSFAIALSAYCHIRAGFAKDAETKIERALDHKRRHPLLQALNSFILSQIGQENAASVALGRAIEFNRNSYHFELPFVLQAHFCQTSKDYDCAEENWERVLRIEASHLQAIVNKSLLHAYKNNFSSASGDIKKGFSMSKNYIPIMELNELNGKNTAN